ncbi:hypothetical protein A5624_08585 [Mycobacterium sp. 1482292.6]|nr:hypothetical protein A5624_08585 [Mycobacterium sp. 1482292.6]
MNRADRRRTKRRPPLSVRWVAANYRCPDCLSETAQPVQDNAGVWHIEVRHDESCPWFTQLKRTLS